ncbi:hypothetical protein ACFWY5_08845 [Nonomuraea sp. NPDC059007]|uniref:hypothetical protein n=1 Tax=Nonomuraea sp. NPDC059007 TaxID=3346692 RepID=UPI003690321E
MRRVLIVSCLLAAGCAAQPEKAYTPRVAPAPAGSVASAVPSPTTETIEVGEKLTVQVEWPAAADPLLKTFTDYYVDSWRAVVSGDDTYLEQVEGPAAKESYDWVKGFGKSSVTGTAKLYALAVSARMGEGAQINACVDETGLRLISKSTGRAFTRQPSWTRETYLQAAITHRGDDGVWRVKDFRHSSEGCDR